MQHLRQDEFSHAMFVTEAPFKHTTSILFSGAGCYQPSKADSYLITRVLTAAPMGDTQAEY